MRFIPSKHQQPSYKSIFGSIVPLHSVVLQKELLLENGSRFCCWSCANAAAEKIHGTWCGINEALKIRECSNFETDPCDIFRSQTNRKLSFSSFK